MSPGSTCSHGCSQYAHLISARLASLAPEIGVIATEFFFVQ